MRSTGDASPGSRHIIALHPPETGTRLRAILPTFLSAAIGTMLCSCGPGEDSTEFSPFPLSWVQLKRNGVKLATEPPLPYS